MDFLQINNLNSIQECDLKIEQMNSLKNNYLKKIKSINELIKSIENYKYQLCEKKGHQWIMEYEDDIYGERFVVCKNCGLF